jgi:hypothetical protein
VIVNPSVIALVGGSAMGGALLLGAAVEGVRVLRGWDLASGSERQLELERRTYLVSTLLGFALAFELASLFLFVFTADAMAPLFTGAMCAAGSLKASPWGYPVLILKLVNAVLAGLWLILNHADQQGYDYPLIRVKYALLLLLAPPALAEVGLQAAFFADLRPEVITSCCGSLFGEGGRGFGSDLASLPPRVAGVALVVTLAAALAALARFRLSGRGAVVAGLLAAAALPVGLAAVVSVISPYVYELPTHHCPFCLLQREYHWLGYPLYGALLLGAVAGAGVALLQPFRRVPSLAGPLPPLQRRLALASLLGLGLFAALSAWQVAASGLRM